jgi:hypothetical protein
MATGEVRREEMTDAYQAGRRVGFGISALVLGLVGFLSLLGAEKAILAIVLGGLAIQGSGPGTMAQRLGWIGICLGILFLFTLAAILIVFHGQVSELLQALQRLS